MTVTKPMTNSLTERSVGVVGGLSRPGDAAGDLPESVATIDACLARQPIFRGDLSVDGYELLFRSAGTGCSGVDGVHASKDVLLSAFSEIGLQRVVADHRAFVNLTREFLVGECALPPCPEQLVLEVLEDTEPDDAVLRGILALREAGYAIALDDFVYHPQLEPFLVVADLVKVELPGISSNELASHVETLRHWPVTLLAEKVETFEEFELCRSLGFELFQGYFLSKPSTLRQPRSRINKWVVVQLLTRVCHPSSSIDEICRIVEQDTGLCYRFLRYVNSCVLGLKRIDSVHHALLMLGMRGVESMLTMIRLAGLGELPDELLKTTIIRGQMCRQLGVLLGTCHPDEFCTVGILSNLETMLQQPTKEVLRELPLGEETRAALLRYEGELGRVLRCVLAYERAQWASAELPPLTPGQIQNAYLSALDRAEEVSHEMTPV